MVSFLIDGVPIDIFHHDCTCGEIVYGKKCPRVFLAYKKWMGATMFHFFGLRIRIGVFK